MLTLKITVTTSDHQEYKGKIHSMDTLSDLAIIKIQDGEPNRAWKRARLGMIFVTAY